jgi:hypothetical protein
MYLRGYEQAVRLAQGAFDDDAANEATVPSRLVEAILAARRRGSREDRGRNLRARCASKPETEAAGHQASALN